MANAADDQKLGLLHNLTAQWALDLLQGNVKEMKLVGEEMVEMVVRPTAQELSVIRAFLKDNNITCAPSGDNALGALERKLKEKQQERTARRTLPTPVLSDPLLTSYGLDGLGE